MCCNLHRTHPLLDLQTLLQREAVRGLLSKQNLPFVTRSPLHQTLHKFSHLVFALDLGAKTPDRSRQTQLPAVDFDRGELQLQIGLARQGSSRFGGDDLAGNTRARGDYSLTVDDDIPV